MITQPDFQQGKGEDCSGQRRVSKSSSISLSGTVHARNSNNGMDEVIHHRNLVSTRAPNVQLQRNAVTKNVKRVMYTFELAVNARKSWQAARDRGGEHRNETRG